MKRKAIEKIEPAKTRKKGHIATVQTLDDIAIINVFNDKVLAARYCINCKTGEHEYWTEKNGWKKGKLITAIEGNWYEWVWMKHDYKYPKIDSEEDRKRLLDITQDKYCANDVWSRIDHMEYSYDYDIRQTAEHNRRAKINNFMSKAPALPKDADEWFFEKTAGEDYMFKEKGTENFSCTNCGESFDRSELTPIHQGKKKAIHNDMVRCPSCGKLVQVKTRTDHITAPPESLYKLDKIDETASVLRIFRVDIEWDSGRHRIEIDEEIRIVIYKQDLFKSNRYNYKIFYNIPWEGWHKSNNLNYRARDGYMYPGDYKGTLKNAAYEAGTRIIEFLAAAGWKLNYNRLLSGVYQVKGYAEKIEYLAKGRFRNLLRETVACTEYPGWNMAYYGPLDIRAKNINKMFYINDRQKINRIRDENGGNEMVRWMQYSDETGEKIPTETLRWLLRCGLGPENIRYHAGKYLSTTQLMNYIRRQQKEQYPGFTEEAVLEQYNDYLSMCKACKKNMKDELTYRPRELKRRHDEIVINKQQMDILKEMMASQAEREQYAQEMREKYPTAEQTLHEIKERYEYENEEYKIIVPESLVDIVKEGRALHHCAGSSERYFDRIETRETYICFLRRKEQEGVPFYTIEVEPSGTIRQHRSYMDEEPGIEQIRDFLKEWQRVLKKRLTKADKELAKISKEKRNANIEDLKAKNNTRVLQGLAEDFMDAEEIEELLDKAV